jgi:Tfp pilus assembly protein PilN
MINLLPPETKQSYRYARRNTRLLFWITAFLIAIIGVVVLTAAGNMAMDHSINQNRDDIANIDARLASQDAAGTQAQVTAITSNLKLMVNVLSKEILFSKLLTQLGNTTPSSVVLTGLSISETESAIDVTARATDYNAAARLQANLADPNNKIFSKADIVTISCGSTTGETNATSTKYPCNVTIRALLAADNPFLFVNTGKAK